MTRLRDDQALEGIIKQMKGQAVFALPGSLCAPVFGQKEADPRFLRIMIGILWLSSGILKKRSDVRFRAPLADIQHVTGLAGHRRYTPIVDMIPDLLRQDCVFPDGMEMRIFKNVTVVDDRGATTLEWIFTPEFGSLFYNPGRFALLDIRQVSKMESGMDIFLYRSVSLVSRMRKPAFTIPEEDLRLVAGLEEDADFKRVAERTRRSVERLQACLGGKITCITNRETGSRRATSMTIQVEKRT